MTPPVPPSRRRRLFLVSGGLVALLLGILVACYFVFRPRPTPPPDMTAAAEANLRGVGYMEQFHYHGAIDDFTEALKFAPDWTPAKINLGIALLNTATPENLQRAWNLFEEVLRQEPNHLHAHYCMGIIALHQNRLNEAYPH